MRESNAARQEGFQIVEVLVSMIIVAIGIVGIAKLQHVATSSNTQAVQRTTASNLTENLIERIRANVSAIDSYFPDDTTVVITSSLATPQVQCINETNCTPSELALYDLWEWQRTVSGVEERDSDGNNIGGLINPVLCMTRPAGGGDGIYSFAIAWHSQSGQQFQAISANSVASSCGTEASLNSFDGVGGNNNVHRRVHWQQVFIDV